MAKKSKKQADAHAKWLVCLFYYNSSIFDIFISIALLDLKAPISLKPDWIRLCVTVRWLINTFYHKRIQGGGKLKRAQG